MKDTLRWAWQSAKGLRWRICASALLGILRVALGLAFVWVSKLLVDAATAGADVSTSRLVQLSVCLASLMLMEMAISLIVQYMTNQTEIKMKNMLRKRVYDHLLSARHDSMGSRHSGDYINRLVEDTRVLAEAMCKKLPDTVVLAVQFVGAFAMLYFMSARLALCVVLIMPFFLILSKVYIKRTRRLTAEVRNVDSAVQSSVQEGLQHHAVVQTLECEPQMSLRLDQLQGDLYGWTMGRTRVSVFSRGMLRLGFISCYLTAFLWSVWHLHTGVITYGTMTAFLQLVARIQNPMASMTQLIPALVHSLTSIDRLSELLQLPRESKDREDMLQAPVGVRLSNVTFAYGENEPKIFDDFTYDFRPGSRTVIMGETGVGKTTLIRMLLALLRPQQGKVEMYEAGERRRFQSPDNNDSVAYRTVAVSAATRCNIVYVPQGNSLFEGTVRENLLLADPDATDVMIREALHTAVATFVYDLPQGLDTRCGELGASLSEGQAQRIAIARALLRRGNVMILDEFNSALDATTASTLLQRLLSSRPQSTIIFISHRREVADHCDAVLELS